ncbi:DUF1653 domain-containing protein [Butyrivibrio sp. WCD3002]|uniref:DUF1653 domain-containing protein n=1 Tax=Butyrivibrio sp. WCD3002 TaxID=1280676 RepID=UPI000419088B|nr:DUF1653 domain-containing protein [Butyrivibrio sp. WCD3002]
MRKPLPQELYRHFKGGKYQVITIARDADTGEEYVIYQALYGEFTVYSRPLSEFVSEVDHEKYPNADQRMRFELFTPGHDDNADTMDHVEEKKSNVVTPDDGVNSNYMNRTIEEEAEDFGMNPLVVRFLDADTCAARLEVLNLLRPVVTNEMIDVMAMAIDTEIPGDDPDDRCAELRECLLTKQRFEVSRLRG